MKEISCSFKAINEELLETIKNRVGVSKITRLFPNSEDSELKRMYMIKVADEKVDSLIYFLLEKGGYAEYAYVAPPRQPCK